MIEKILNNWGYFKIRTTDDVLNAYAQISEDLEIDIDPIEEAKMFKQLKEVDGFLVWIDAIIAGDIRKHFGAPNDQQRFTIRGMMQRFVDFKKRLVTIDKPVTTKITGVRYGS